MKIMALRVHIRQCFCYDSKIDINFDFFSSSKILLKLENKKKSWNYYCFESK